MNKLDDDTIGICKICMRSPVEHAFNCGHTVCDDCNNNLKGFSDPTQKFKCPTCRNNVTYIHRIYI